MKLVMITILTTLALQAQAHIPEGSENTYKPILADSKDLRALNIPLIASDAATGVGFAYINSKMENSLHEQAHKVGKCGGFEDISGEVSSADFKFTEVLGELRSFQQKNINYQSQPYRLLSAPFNENVQSAISEVSEQNLYEMVTWLSSFTNRSQKAPDPNVHVVQLHERLKELLTSTNLNYKIEEVVHTRTAQRSLKVELLGSEKPSEIIVLGGHLDSLGSFWTGNTEPGADDNASGSANLFEALRILTTKEQPKRSVHFIWYAAEEAGLLGSSEIAQEYKAQNKDVIAVLQLDMTLHPGSGELVIASITDFTSAWLRDYLVSINNLYLGVKILEDKCGYACSDHASWYRMSFPTVMPTEATLRGLNPKIHSANDKINITSSFKHSAVFSKIALIFALDLGNNDLRQPF